MLAFHFSNEISWPNLSIRICFGKFHHFSGKQVFRSQTPVLMGNINLPDIWMGSMETGMDVPQKKTFKAVQECSNGVR